MRNRKTLITQALAVSKRVPEGRAVHDVLECLVEEVGELATEIAISRGRKKRAPGPDGIIGEAIDVILAASDILYLEFKKQGLDLDPQTYEKLLMERAEKKLTKWENGVK